MVFPNHFLLCNLIPVKLIQKAIFNCPAGYLHIVCSSVAVEIHYVGLKAPEYNVCKFNTEFATRWPQSLSIRRHLNLFGLNGNLISGAIFTLYMALLGNVSLIMIVEKQVC